jgi:sulfoxide reductase catalytic subunit YedY
MWIRKNRAWDLPESAATPESVYFSRRRFIAALGASGIIAAGAVPAARRLAQSAMRQTPAISNAISNKEFGPVGRPITNSDTVFTFNNFYEFSYNKSAVAGNSREFRLDPWTLLIDGLVKKPVQIGLEDILQMQLEQRTCRFRCVEAWAMTVPWIGLPLSQLLLRAEPLPEARFISIQSFLDTEQAPRQKSKWMPWPYRETLTMNEAMHPLTLAAVGMYGSQLLPQSGAPLRIVIPWKYGFKGPKSVVRISLTSAALPTFWNTLQPDEYDVVANVDPDKPHPRWSQKSEALLGTWGKRVPTVKYNGYGRWVADLYQGPAAAGGRP